MHKLPTQRHLSLKCNLLQWKVPNLVVPKNRLTFNCFFEQTSYCVKTRKIFEFLLYNLLPDLTNWTNWTSFLPYCPIQLTLSTSVHSSCCPYLQACTAPGFEQNSWHTLLKILPCPNFVAGDKKSKLNCWCLGQTTYFPHIYQDWQEYKIATKTFNRQQLSSQEYSNFY